MAVINSAMCYYRICLEQFIVGSNALLIERRTTADLAAETTLLTRSEEGVDSLLVETPPGARLEYSADSSGIRIS